MKVRIINTKENPVIIKSDKKPPFVDKPSWAKDSFLLAPYKEGYTTNEAITEHFHKAYTTGGYRIGRLNYFEGETTYLQLCIEQANDIKYLLEGEQLKPFFSDGYYMYGNHITLDERPSVSHFIWGVRGYIHWDRTKQHDFIQVYNKMVMTPLNNVSANLKVGSITYDVVNQDTVYTFLFVVDVEKQTRSIYRDAKKIYSEVLQDDEILYIHRDAYFYMGAVSLFTKDSEITESNIQDVLNIMEVSCTV